MSLDSGNPSQLQPFVKKHDIRFPIAVDTNHDFAQKYGVRGTPTSFLISPEGRVIGGATGPREWDSDIALKIVQELLKSTSR